MKRIFQHIIIAVVGLLLFSCNDDFVDEQLEISGVAISSVIVSPNWEAQSYEFMLEGLGNAEFTIDTKPDWLTTESSTGSLLNGIGSIRCEVNEVSAYSSTGIYIDQMLISVGGRQYAVPVYYISEGNPRIMVSRVLEINYNDYTSYVQLSNTGDGILLWDVLSMPDWLIVDQDQFDYSSLMLGKNSTANIPFIVNTEKATLVGTQEGTIVLATNDASNSQVEIAVKIDLGSPMIDFYDKIVDFGTSETEKTIQFHNIGSGLLVWSFEQLPDWLTISPNSGMSSSYGFEQVIVTCDRTNLQQGLNTATIALKTNVPDYPSIEITITVREPGVGENIQLLEGKIVDVTFNKSTNTLYYVTGLPNKLVAYDLLNKTVLQETDLEKAPTSLGINADFSRATIGHGGMISSVNLSSFTVDKIYETDYTIHDVEWAKDDWYCYTKTDDRSNFLYWINTATDEFYGMPLSMSLGTADLKKVPGQSYMVGWRKNVSPSGVYVFDIDNRTLESYEHSSLGKLWFFDNNELVLTANSDILRTSTLLSGSGDLSAIGRLTTATYAYPTWAADFSPELNSIWVISSYHQNAYFQPETATIYQFEDNDYTLVKKYLYDNYMQIDAQSSRYEVEAHYLFANSAGTELSVLRKGKDNDVWSIEFIPIP